jgi:hypothetical protein
MADGTLVAGHPQCAGQVERLAAIDVDARPVPAQIARMGVPGEAVHEGHLNHVVGRKGQRRSGGVVARRHCRLHDRLARFGHHPEAGPEGRQPARQRAFARQLTLHRLVRAVDLELVGPLWRDPEGQAGFGIEGHRLAQQAPGRELQGTRLALQPVEPHPLEAVSVGQRRGRLRRQGVGGDAQHGDGTTPAGSRRGRFDEPVVYQRRIVARELPRQLDVTNCNRVGIGLRRRAPARSHERGGDACNPQGSPLAHSEHYAWRTQPVDRRAENL